MIFAFAEDGTVEVLESAASAQTFEPFDVENQVFVFYAEDGTWLEPRFIRPNRRRFFGLIVEQGAFELVPRPEGDVTVDVFDLALSEAVALRPNPYFESLEALSQHVASKRRTAPG